MHDVKSEVAASRSPVRATASAASAPARHAQRRSPASSNSRIARSSRGRASAAFPEARSIRPSAISSPAPPSSAGTRFARLRSAAASSRDPPSTSASTATAAVSRKINRASSPAALRPSSVASSTRPSARAIPDLVVEDVPGDDRVALGESLVIAAVEQCELFVGAEEPQRDMAESPDALEIGRRLLGDRGGALGRDPAALVVELKRVDAGDPQVGEGQIRRRAFLLQHDSGVLEVPEGSVRLVELPAAPAEVDPGAGGIEAEAEVVELLDPVLEELLGCRWLAVEPAEMPYPSEQQRSLGQIGDVREDALEKLGGLPERDCALGFVGGAQAGVDGLDVAAGVQEMARHGRRASLRCEEGVCSPGVDPLSLREDGVACDRLPGERVAPAVAVARLHILFEQLLRDGGFES